MGNTHNIDVEKVKEIFYDIQEEGYYTHGLDSNQIPEKVTIDQASNPIEYPSLQPILSRSIKKLRALGFTIVTHILIAAPTYVGSKTLGDKKKMLCSENVPQTIDLKKYKSTSSYATVYYTPPAKIFSVYTIEIFLDPPKPKAKTTGEKIKDFLTFNKEPDPEVVDLPDESSPPVNTPPATTGIGTSVQKKDTTTKTSPWAPSPLNTKVRADANKSDNLIYVAPSLTAFDFTVFVTDQTKKYVFKLYNFPANAINRKLVRERELTRSTTVLNRISIPNGTYYWEVWCGGLIVKEGKIKFS